ncbi:MAG: hypothetical protein VKJ64_17205 [Leptolyngbyaceae bacterium]|nr:hypothetical protein [Leptolyngbyaceae bacterium]
MTPNVVVMAAIEKLDYRVTPGDIATNAGLDVKVAERDLVDLAAETGAHLQVSDGGDIAYQFPQNFRTILRNKFWQLRLQQGIQQIWRILFYLIRVSFGIVLVLSILLLAILAVAVVIIVIKGGQKKEEGDRSESGFPSVDFDGNYPVFTSFQGWQLARLVSLSMDLFSNYSYQRPVYQQSVSQAPTSLAQKLSPSQISEASHHLNFLEAMFSFLFGDGNPNANLEEIRWQTIGAVIRNHQGAIASEQVVPYLDNIPQGIAREDEDYILPVLTRFNGRPAVSPEGQLIYYFPELQITAKESSYQSISPYLKEQRWSFSQATGEQKIGAIALGIVNLVLVIFVGLSAFREPFFSELQAMGLAGILEWYPILLVYGIGFLSIPVVRYCWLQWRNRKLEQRNAERREQAQRLEDVTPALQAKLDYAQKFAAQTIIDQRNLIYSTETDLLDQELS